MTCLLNPSLRAWLAGLALAATGLPALANSPNLVVNGDFEAPATATWRCFANSSLGGWTNAHPGASSGSCYTHLDGPAAPAYSGQQSLYLNDSSVVGVTLSQDIAVTAVTTYQLSFALTGLTDRPTLPVVQVDAGAGSAPATFTGQGYGQWAMAGIQPKLHALDQRHGAADLHRHCGLHLPRRGDRQRCARACPRPVVGRRVAGAGLLAPPSRDWSWVYTPLTTASNASRISPAWASKLATGCFSRRASRPAAVCG